MTGRIPVRLVTGSEGKEIGEQEEVKAHLMVCLDGSGMVGARWSTASRATAAEKNGGARRRPCCGGGLGCGGVWELRETRAVLKAGSARKERLRRCGATVSFELAGIRAGGGDVQVLRRARVGELRLCSELATATARWRPRSSVGMAWRGEEGSNARGSGSRRSLGCRVWRWAKQEVACGLPRRWAVPLSAGGGEAEREAGG